MEHKPIDVAVLRMSLNAAGVTQNEVATEVGQSPANISLQLDGKRTLQPAVVDAIHWLIDERMRDRDALSEVMKLAWDTARDANIDPSTSERLARGASLVMAMEWLLANRRAGAAGRVTVPYPIDSDDEEARRGA